MSINDLKELFDKNIEVETVDHKGVKEIRLIHIEKIRINDDPSCPCRLAGKTILKGEIIDE